jgi:predicted glycosyltransferase
MFRVIWRHDPAITAPFFSDLAKRRFRAVILSSDLSDLTASDSNFGSEFVDVMKRNYDLVSVHGDLRVYLPKSMRDR